MTRIIVNDLPDESREELKRQALNDGLSLESYILNILLKQSQVPRVKSEPVDILQCAEQLFGRDAGVELELPYRGSEREVVDFG